jgi:hypothetical protein
MDRSYNSWRRATDALVVQLGVLSHSRRAHLSGSVIAELECEIEKLQLRADHLFELARQTHHDRTVHGLSASLP